MFIFFFLTLSVGGGGRKEKGGRKGKKKLFKYRFEVVLRLSRLRRVFSSWHDSALQRDSLSFIFSSCTWKGRKEGERFIYGYIVQLW